MKKILSIFIAALFIAGSAFAGTSGAPDYEGAAPIYGNNDPGDPICEYLLVRNAVRGAIMEGISSGDVLSWDLTSADGVTVSEDLLGWAPIGVAITAIATADNSAVDTSDDNWGYMCIRGRCLAMVDATGAIAGMPIYGNGGTLSGSFATGVSGGMTANVSKDCGVLLQYTASDTLVPVWLN